MKKYCLALLLIPFVFLLGCGSSSSNPATYAADILVSVPYWSTGEVYLGTGSNPTFYKLTKINDVTYSGATTLNTGGTYYFDRGTTDTKSTMTLGASGDAKVQDAVVDWLDSTKTISKPGFMKGVTFGAMLWTAAEKTHIDQSLAVLPEFNVNWIILVPDWFVFPGASGITLESTIIRPFYSTDGTFPNPTKYITATLATAEVQDIIRKAKAAGIKVMLKPHIDPIDFGMTPGSGRGCLQPQGSDWDAWFASYQKFINFYADLASAENVDMFCVGCELDDVAMPGNSGVTADATARWKNVIASVKTHYSGPLTYSESVGNDGTGAARIYFWDALDYIGFEPYFGVTSSESPTLAELKAGFDSKFDAYAKPLYDTYGKPIILTEANCYSYHGVNKTPIDSAGSAAVDHQAQADYYEALHQSLETRDWIKGVFWWGWFLDTTIKGKDLSADKNDPFARKIAGQVMRKWYGKIAP
jgi:hypothetical protein